MKPMTTLTSPISAQAGAAARLPKEFTRDMLPADGPAWLHDLRTRALAAFAGRGLPTTRDEAWKDTSVRAIAETAFVPGPPAPRADRARVPAVLPSQAIPDDGAPRIVFVDGRLATDLATIDLPAGVTVQPLLDAATADPALRTRLEALPLERADAFALLGIALMSGGLVIRVRAGATVDPPLFITHLSSGSPDAATPPHAVSLRHIIDVGAGAQVTVVEEYLSTDDGPSLTITRTELDAADDAVARHVMVERESEDAFQVGVLATRQGRNSTVDSHSILLGGRIVRNDVNPVLAGEHAHGVLNGLFLPRRRQHHDNHMLVVHEAPHCASRQYYRGILADQAKGVFTGRIYVAREAQKTDAIQTSDNLLLSTAAQIVTQPQLEIYADDVRCTHGATVGQLNAHALFYLRARGIPEAEARLMLLFAFVEEAIDRIEPASLRAPLRDAVQERLAGAITADPSPAHARR
ncbi:MAG: Fe-S cluster assembly protein SufD [Phycisphaeraceae bacterium]|nr:Fe-S cluster assembly protein SufD [Phycisphaeraceae bacterium]